MTARVGKEIEVKEQWRGGGGRSTDELENKSISCVFELFVALI